MAPPSRNRLRRFSTSAPFALLSLGLLLASSPAHADQVLQGVYEATVGATDNVTASPDEPIADVPPKESDLFAVLSPGVLYAIRSDTAQHRFAYTLAANLFARNFDASAFTNRLESQSFFDLSPSLDLVLGASVTQDHRNTDNRFSEVSSTVLRAGVPGTGAFLTARLDESIHYEIARDWRARQAASAAVLTPVFESGTRTYETDQRLGVERVWRDDALGPEIAVEYSLMEDPVTLDGTPTSDQSQIITAAQLRWRHDWSRDVTSSLSAGALQMNRLTSEGRYRTVIGEGILAYTRRDGNATLTLRRSATTSLFLAQTTVVNEVDLRGSVPLDDDRKFWLGASAGVQDGELLDLEGQPAAEVDVYLADLGVSWRPYDYLSFTARFQHVTQRSDALAPPLPLTYASNALMLGVRWIHPHDEQLVRTYHAPRRVDQSDTIDDRGPAPELHP